MHQLKYNKLPKSFEGLVYFNPDNRLNTRQQQLAICHRFRTTFTSQLPYHSYPRIWNNMELELHDVANVSSFKGKLRTKMLNHYSNDIRCLNIRCNQCFPNQHWMVKFLLIHWFAIYINCQYCSMTPDWEKLPGNLNVTIMISLITRALWPSLSVIIFWNIMISTIS